MRRVSISRRTHSQQLGSLKLKMSSFEEDKGMLNEIVKDEKSLKVDDKPAEGASSEML